MDHTPRTKAVTWHTAILPSETQQALDYLSRQAWMKRSKWYLAGGTALALQVGHRASVDLDFFTPQKDFSAGKLLRHFSENMWTTDVLREGTIYGRLHEAKVSFIAYPYFIARGPAAWFRNVRVLNAGDIAVMKVIAISQRGRKRDFVDLYWLCNNLESLDAILWRLPDQYPTVAHDFHHILKSLAYFADAEQDPMPRLFFDASWKGIKEFFKREAAASARKLLRLP